MSESDKCDIVCKKKGRPTLLSDEERIEHKRLYDLKYQKKRYIEDPEFKEKRKIKQKIYYQKKKELNAH
jgi:hypothetical protein